MTLLTSATTEEELTGREKGDIELGRGQMDYGAAFGIVIGEQCRNVAKEDYLNVVTEYTCLNVISTRNDQDVERNWRRGKAFDNSTSPDRSSPRLKRYRRNRRCDSS